MTFQEQLRKAREDREARIAAVLARWEREGESNRSIKRLASEAHTSDTSVSAYLFVHGIEFESTSKHAVRKEPELDEAEIEARYRVVREEVIARYRAYGEYRRNEPPEIRIYRDPRRIYA